MPDNERSDNPPSDSSYGFTRGEVDRAIVGGREHSGNHVQADPDWVSWPCLHGMHDACSTTTGESSRCGCACHGTSLGDAGAEHVDTYIREHLVPEWFGTVLLGPPPSGIGHYLEEKDRELADATPGILIRHGQPRFDAVGLFTQWLAERIALTTERPFSIELMHGEPMHGERTTVQLVVTAPDGFELTHTWAVSWLNAELEKANGRGDPLRAVIRDCAMAVANDLEHHRTGE